MSTNVCKQFSLNSHFLHYLSGRMSPTASELYGLVFIYEFVAVKISYSNQNIIFFKNIFTIFCSFSVSSHRFISFCVHSEI